MVEVAASNASYDLHEKLRVYRRNGVQEYLVLLTHEQEIRWFYLVDGEYKLLLSNDTGVWQSQCFPGLHLHGNLFWADDMAGLLKWLQAGLTTAEHQTFVAQPQASQANIS